MLKSLSGRTKLCNYACALFTLCLLILQFTPFWHFGDESLSISGYVWLDCDNTGIASWFSSQLGAVPNINSIVLSAVPLLVLGVIGFIVCLIKPRSGFVSLLSAIAALFGLYGYIFEPAFRLGSTWVLQLILCIAIIVATVMAIMYSNKQKGLGAEELTEGDITDRVAAIKALGNTDGNVNSEENFHKLLSLLSNEVPECRIAVAETLGQTSSDIAFTHISHALNTEQDERVIKAMRAALRSIRENSKKKHSEKE